MTFWHMLGHCLIAVGFVIRFGLIPPPFLPLLLKVYKRHSWLPPKLQTIISSEPKLAQVRQWKILTSITKRLGQEDKAQNNSGVKIFAYKVGATQIKSILAPCHNDFDLLFRSITFCTASLCHCGVRHYSSSERLGGRVRMFGVRLSRLPIRPCLHADHASRFTRVLFLHHAKWTTIAFTLSPFILYFLNFQWIFPYQSGSAPPSLLCSPII